MSRHHYRRRRCDSLSSAVDDTAYIASRLGPVGALWTGVIGFAVFYAVLPICLMVWATDRKAALNGPAAAAFANLLDQVIWHRFISPCQWAGVAILLVCSTIAIWKYIGQADIDGDDVTFLSAVSKAVSRLIGH